MDGCLERDQELYARAASLGRYIIFQNGINLKTEGDAKSISFPFLPYTRRVHVLKDVKSITNPNRKIFLDI